VKVCRFSPSQGAMVSAAQKMTNGDVVNDFTVTSGYYSRLRS
jgi:hypothetical protein